MLPSLLVVTLLGLSQAPIPAPEPDGSRPVGTAASFRAEPAPPEWLRTASLAAAAVDTRHYIYEVYAGPKDQWLVRYLMLPEGDEAFREIEQAFLFGPDPKKKPQELKPSEPVYESRSATWKKTLFLLVDRRELMKP